MNFASLIRPLRPWMTTSPRSRIAVPRAAAAAPAWSRRSIRPVTRLHGVPAQPAIVGHDMDSLRHSSISFAPRILGQPAESIGFQTLRMLSISTL